MAGTIIITGANGSLAIPAVQHLLTKYPTYTALLTVRNTSDTDLNTKRLRETVMQHPQANSSIRKLDLADLSAVHDFADTVAAEITDGKLPPLASIVCKSDKNLSINTNLINFQSIFKIHECINTIYF